MCAAFQSRDQVLCNIPSALTNSLFLQCCPAFVGNGFSRKIDNGIEQAEIGDIVKPCNNVYAFWQLLTGFFWVTANNGEFVFMRKLADKRRAN